jgi:hypothetical protein
VQEPDAVAGDYQRVVKLTTVGKPKRDALTVDGYVLVVERSEIVLVVRQVLSGDGLWPITANAIVEPRSITIYSTFDSEDVERSGRRSVSAYQTQCCGRRG